MRSNPERRFRGLIDRAESRDRILEPQKTKSRKRNQKPALIQFSLFNKYIRECVGV